MSKGLQPFAADSSRILIGLRHSPAGGNRLIAGRIERAQFYNRALTAEEIANSAAYFQHEHVPQSLIVQRLNAESRKRFEMLQAERRNAEDHLLAIQRSQTQSVYTNVSIKPEATHVLLRGDVGTPGDQVLPAGLRALPMMTSDFGVEADATDAARRQKLAEWITNKNNPLLARVLVNRVWQYHFGQGLVATPSDFGFNGGRPSHPELLDWLAEQFIASGYRMKALHRLIVTSNTYRQSSAARADAMSVDADKRLLWRKSPIRLDAESIRDAMLVTADRLDPSVGGQGYRDLQHKFYKGSHFYESIHESEHMRRRTIYRFAPRGGQNLFLSTFDCPDPSATSPRRAVTTTPLQALALLNNSLVFEMADHFTSRIRKAVGRDVTAQARLAYELAYGRDATSDEVELCRQFIESNDLPALCRVLFNSNEFLTIQ